MDGPVVPRPFALDARRLRQSLTAEGIPFADMRQAPALELQFAGLGEMPERRSRAAGVEPFEGPIRPLPVKKAPVTQSRLRWFLDGAQRTLPYVRIGTVPVFAVVAAAGVVERTPGGSCAVAPGTLRIENRWLIPRGTGIPAVESAIATIERKGATVVDTVADGEVDRQAAAFDYLFLQQRAYDTARDLRADLEREVLRSFRGDPARRSADDPAWIVVDGRLPEAVPRAVGLVKRVTDHLLPGEHLDALLSLLPGHRTSAFFPQDRGQGGDVTNRRTLWYLRFWDSTGMDAHHSLVRVETSQEVRRTEEIDELSGWLLAERTPRATGDERWATLLYPIHLLERVLRRQIDGHARGWTGH